MKKLLFLFTLVSILSFKAQAQKVGEKAPDFTVDFLSGEKFTLSDNSDKLVVIFFFGNACPPCIAVSPTVQSKIVNAYSSNANFKAIGLDVWDGNASQVTSFKNQSGLTIPLGFDASSIAADYNTQRDRLVVVDKEGILRHNNTSTNASGDISNVISVIDQHLGEDSPGNGTTSTEDTESNSTLNFYPNPVVDLVNVDLQFKNTGLATFKLISTTGKMVYQKNTNYLGDNSSPVSLDLSNIPNGIYFLSVELNNEHIIRKISVLH